MSATPAARSSRAVPGKDASKTPSELGKWNVAGTWIAGDATISSPRLYMSLGLTLVGLAAVGWSTAGYFTRLITIDALKIASCRGFFSAILIGGYLSCRFRGDFRGAFKGFGGAGWSVATISTFATITYIAALRCTSVANVAVIHATGPLIAAALAWMVLGNRPSGKTMMGAMLAILGISITVRGSLSNSDLVGNELALLMTASMALVTVLSRKYRSVSMIPATFVSAVQLAFVGVLVAAPFAISARDLTLLALFSAIQAASFAAYIEGARHIAPASAALISVADVPLATLWVWLAFNEVPTNATVVGGFFVAMAVLLGMVGLVKS
jgi:drug/metabolite transporter (DMT)-like permease